MDNKRERSSGLELLRILCMIMIITHHYSIHGGIPSDAVMSQQGAGMMVQMLRMFGRPACSIFALMSGYFLVRRGKNCPLRRIVPLLAEQWFYSVGILAVVLCFHLRSVSFFDTVHALVPVIWGNWYVVGYVVLYALLSFINPWILSMEKKTYRRLLMILLVFWSVIPTFAEDSQKYGPLDFFLVMYLTGGYISLHGRQGEYPNRWNLAASLVSAGAILGSVAAINTAGHLLHSELIVTLACWFYNYDSVLSVIFAISTFLYFSQLTFSSRWINYLAGSMVGIYLIHDDDLVRKLLWEGLSPNAAHLDSVWIHAPVKIMAVFLVCLAVDLLRRATVERVFLKWFHARCAAWDQKHIAARKDA